MKTASGIRTRTRGRGVWTRPLMIVLSVAALAFEQSPANEALRANVAFRVLDETGDAIAVGFTVLAITLPIEGIPALLIAAGLHLNPDLLRRLMRKRALDDLPADPASHRDVRSTLTDVGIALGVGAGLVVVRRRWADPARSFADDIRSGAWACAVVAVVSGFIGHLVAGGIENAARIGLERPAEIVVDYATDWRFWTVVVVLIQGLPWLIGKLRRTEPDEVLDLRDPR